MISRNLSATCGLLSLLVASAGCMTVAHAVDRKSLDVESMLRIATVGDSSQLGWLGDGGAKNLAHISPDGTKAAIVLTSGDPADKAIIGKLLLFEVSELINPRKRPQPQVVTEFRSRTNYLPIANVQWVDNDTLVFAGTDGAALTQVYRLQLDGGKPIQITSETQAISAFARSKAGGMLVVTHAAPSPKPEDNAECLAHGCRVTAKRLEDAISGAGDRGAFPGELSYYDAAGARRRLDSLYGIAGVGGCYEWFGIPGGLSPNGRYALFICTRAKWPSWWSEYTVDPRFSEMIAKGNTGYAHQYILVDTASNKVRPATAAPYLRFAPIFDPIWIDGGNRLLLAGAVEPLEGVSEAERKVRAARIGVVSVDPQTGKTEFEFVLDHQTYRRVAAARWDDEERILTLDAIARANDAVVPLAWRKKRSGWKSVSVPAKASPPVSFSLGSGPINGIPLAAGM